MGIEGPTSVHLGKGTESLPLSSDLWVAPLLVWVSLTLEPLCFSFSRECCLHWVRENHAPSNGDAEKVLEL